jgi:hypothetical protein
MTRKTLRHGLVAASALLAARLQAVLAQVSRSQQRR